MGSTSVGELDSFQCSYSGSEQTAMGYENFHRTFFVRSAIPRVPLIIPVSSFHVKVRGGGGGGGHGGN